MNFPSTAPPLPAHAGARARLPRALGLALLLLGAGARAQAIAPGDGEAVRERPSEFLDSLADQAIAPDPQQLYRKNGLRREVDIGRGAIAWLDEALPTLLDAPRGTPPSAGAPGRAVGIRVRRPDGAFDLGYQRSVLGRRMAVGGERPLGEGLSAYGSWRQDRSEVEDLPGAPGLTQLRRRDAELGLRWQGETEAGSPWSTDWGWHRGRLDPDPVSAYAPEASAAQWVWRGRLQPADWPGLSLSLQWAQPIGASTLSDPRADGERLQLGADWLLPSALGPLPAGSRLSWVETPRLGLLGDEGALTLPAAYRRRLGLDLSDGSPQGRVYGQLRQHSLADARDSVGVFGWRRPWEPLPRWAAETQLEQSIPLAGATAQRATQGGLRLRTGRAPQWSFGSATEVVNAEIADSAYQEFKWTQRLADDWLGALRFNTTRTQPHGRDDAGDTEYKAAVAVGWREPQQRALHLLTRLTWAGREADPQAVGVGDRRARIWLGHAGLTLDERQSVSLRLSRRLERDEARVDAGGTPVLRRTDFMLARWIWERSRQGDARWSVSLHAAAREDSVEGRATGWGGELGWRLSSKATLALGYNPRGFSDNEITVDERPRQGWNLRLRFTIDSAVSRWLDRGRSDEATGRPHAPGALSADLPRHVEPPPAGLGPALEQAEQQGSPAAF